MESLELTDRQSAAVQKTPNRVTLDTIKAEIEHTEIMRPALHPHMTLAVLTLRNGFVVVGKAAPADPENFNEELGVKFAVEDAIRQIWPLMAFRLRDEMTK